MRGLLFSFSTAVARGDHLSAGKSAQSLTSCPLALISAACDSDGRVGLSWSMLLTQGIHGSQLVGGQISVYHRELSGALCPGQALPPPFPPSSPPKTLIPPFSLPVSVLVTLDIGGETRIGVAELSDVM